MEAGGLLGVRPTMGGGKGRGLSNNDVEFLRDVRGERSANFKRWYRVLILAPRSPNTSHRPCRYQSSRCVAVYCIYLL